MIQELPKERWPELTEIFAREFDAILPDPTSTILADVDEDGTIKGFMVVEFLWRLGQIWQTGGKTREMFDQVDLNMPPGNSVIAIASEPRFEGLCKMYGMRQIEGTIYRKDF